MEFYKKFLNFSSVCGDSGSFGGDDGGGDGVGEDNFGADFETFLSFSINYSF